MPPVARIDGFAGEFLREFDIAERQLTAMADGVPSSKYAWRPDESARSISEVFVHVAAGSFMLLEALGTPAPRDLYPSLSSGGQERVQGLIRRNDELENTVRDKDAVAELLRRSLYAVRKSLEELDAAGLEHQLHFFGEQTTMRRVCLRLLAHTHEHMGQLIGYLRMNGLTPGWPDWRPDRRPPLLPE